MRDAVDQVLEVNHAADFGQDRERVRIPFEQDLVGLDRRAVGDSDLARRKPPVAFFFAALVVDDRDDAVAVHRDQFALVVADRTGCRCNFAKPSDLASCLDCSADPRRRATDVERTHGELRAGFADGLRRDDADRLAALHQPAGRQVAAVAGCANAALRFAGQHRADLDALDTGRLNRAGQFFGDLLVDRRR